MALPDKKNKPLRVLVIEDSEDDTLLIMRELRKAGYEPEFERVDTAEALKDSLSRRSWDVLISDYSMPVFDGITALRIMQETGLDLPFILVSGTISDEYAVHAMKAGAHDFMNKVNLSRLVPAIEREMRETLVRRERARMARELEDYHASLEKKIEERTIELKKATKRVSFFANAIENSSQPFAAGDPDGRIINYNRAFADLTGYSAGELRSMNWAKLTPEEWRNDIAWELAELYRTGLPRTYHKEYIKKDGTRVPIEVRIHLVRDEKGNDQYYYVFVNDITERKKMEDEIRHMAHHDPLTGLPNRRLFADLLSVELAQARRHESKLAVLFLDLDRFKEINDLLGHQMGDRLLKEVAFRLRQTIRESDSVGRIGGDEFNIVLADIRRTDDITDIAKKIVESLRRPLTLDGNELTVTTSIGISVYPDDTENIDSLLRYADLAMYSAKESGRNAYRFYNPALDVRSRERMRFEQSLRQSLQRGELTVFYQPQIDIGTGKVVSAESLVRWRHPDLGLLEPDRFIPFAEQNGLIGEIDEWVLRTVCVQGREWLDAGLQPVRLTVNLSAREFQEPGLVQIIADALRDSNLPPEALDIEITESTAMSDVDRTARHLRELTGMGVHVSIDDFGTGYSSLNYLKRLPIDKLKIDKSFVRDLAHNPDDRAIIHAVSAMAHSMKIKVLAEGVETKEQLSFLRETSCDEAQGFLFSAPLPADRFRELAEAGW